MSLNTAQMMLRTSLWRSLLHLLCGTAAFGSARGQQEVLSPTVENALSMYFPHLAEACTFESAGSRADMQSMDSCIELLLPMFGLDVTQREGDDDTQPTDLCMGRMRGLGNQVGYVNATRKVCWASPGINLTAYGCEALGKTAWELMTVLFRYLTVCAIDDEILSQDVKDLLAEELLTTVGQTVQNEIDRHVSSPLGGLLGSKMKSVVDDLTSPFSPSWRLRQIVLRSFALIRSISQFTNWIIWRDSHYLWLMDSLREGKVVHSAWGPIEGWDELGANDARAHHILQDSQLLAPHFDFSEETGQRNDILASLLTKLHNASGNRDLVVVEVGVFRAGLSKFILSKLPFVRLLGVDPYIGTDGTFPGDFSVTLNPDDAYATASAVYDHFGDRASLLPQTSEDAARGIPDSSVDAVFIDGCHLYECVTDDLTAWLPKLRGPGSLVVGHDFSPQWPGVVRAVYEHRKGGKKVALGNDWTFWWHVE